PLRQELPALLPRLPALCARLQLRSRPQYRSLGGAVEALGVEHGSLVVVAQQDHLAAHDGVDALARVGAVADHRAEAVDVGDGVLVYVSQDGLERFVVTMDVADDGLHAWLSLVVAARQALPRLGREGGVMGRKLRCATIWEVYPPARNDVKGSSANA